MPKYNRDQARRYARWYAKNVCHDGSVACVRGGKTVFDHFTPGTALAGLTNEGEDDCTHFVSSCIGNHGGKHAGQPGGQAGGGLSIPADFFREAYGILGAPRLVKHLLSKGYAQVIGKEKMARDDATKLIGSLEMGDVIAYAASSSGGYAHTVLHLYDGKIACHTMSRLDEPWSAVGHAYATLLHIIY